MSLSIQYSDQSFKENFRSFCIVGIIIFVCALAGILGRPLFFLAIFWPANAVLLGLFLRYKNLRNIGGWLGAFTSFMLADLVTGNYFILTLFLSIANVLNVDVTQISIKATTTETLGFTGRQEGILSTATVLITHSK